MSRNVDISLCDLPERLKRLREAQHLTQADLAERAGLSYRTVLDLEKGRRDRVQSKTLMLLSNALGVDYETLIEPVRRDETPVGRRRIPTWALFLGPVLLVAAVLATLGLRDADRYEVDREGHRVVARDDWLGLRCWSRSFEAKIRFCEISPRNKDVVLVGLYGDTVEGGYLVALGRDHGRILWRVAPDVAAVADAFGEEVAYAANYSCTAIAAPDLDGDGVPELVARFCHALWYPNTLCFIGPEGELESQYSHKGHLYAQLVQDLDGDGRDELIECGTNNTKAYQGATVLILDESHRSGASVDAEAAPQSTVPDSARVRLVLPQFPEPYMRQLGAQRLEASLIKSGTGADGEVHLLVTVGTKSEAMLIVELDRDLRPLSCGVCDGFLDRMEREHWPAELVDGTGPGDPAWREAWLEQAVRFEAGHWPPDLPSSP